MRLDELSSVCVDQDVQTDNASLVTSPMTYILAIRLFEEILLVIHGRGQTSTRLPYNPVLNLCKIWNELTNDIRIKAGTNEVKNKIRSLKF